MREGRIVQKQAGFGKRGNVSMPGHRPAAPEAPSPNEPERASPKLPFPKWMIGGAAGLMLLALVVGSGGIGSGGLLGGLLGGFLANKLFSNRSLPASPSASPSQTASPAASKPGAPPVERGGLGTTTSSSRSGGSSFFGG